MIDGLLKSDRKAIAQALTLVESTRPDHQTQAAQLMAEIEAKSAAVDALKPPAKGAALKSSLRIAVTGLPGAGKSTLIERLGMLWIQQGHTVGVLAIDPSSPTTGGSILGDKTRMNQLAQSAEAFIRPTAAAGNLGGVSRRTRDQISVLECAGFDRIIVETVGVGQNETTVAGMVDLAVLVLIPGAGDDLQGIKRGILEISDLVVVNKSEGAARVAAERTRSDYTMAFSVTDAGAPSPRAVLLCSGQTGEGIPELLAAIESKASERQNLGQWTTRRNQQKGIAFEESARDLLWAQVMSDPVATAEYQRMREAVVKGNASASEAALKWVERVRTR